MASGIEFLNDYTPVGDLTVVSICVVMIILIFFSYIRRTRSFRIFISIVGMLMLASFANIGHHMVAASSGSYRVASALGVVYHALLFFIFLLFVVYIDEVARLERKARLLFDLAAVAIYLAEVAGNVVSAVRGGDQAPGGSAAFNSHRIFMIGYIAFAFLLIAMLAAVRRRLYKRVMGGFYATVAFSFLILFIQGVHGQTSFTVATFLYPVISMFYILHSNPYDAQLGAMDLRALEDAVRYNYENKRGFLFMSLYLRDFDEEGKPLPEALKATFRRFAGDYFKGATLFEAGKGHEMLIFSERRNPDYEQRINKILESFYAEYKQSNYDYKIVIGKSIDEISRRNEYVSFIRSVHRGMKENSVHWVKPEDVQRFNRYDYIQRELADICRKRDLDDPRVLAFCQPVYNIKTNRYDTAEALMRLRLSDDSGMVFPDQFIPIAEENGFIHTLTLIILNKTCREVRRLMDEGYAVSRVSVNVSALELKDEHFCDDIIHIINDNGLQGDKIAIELTESRSESDFMVVKGKIGELRQRGIKFYLDDFGTGYSNMERIMELPFDIIKFDRSLVIASGASERSKKIVVSLAHMFDELNYSVLYEGVETDLDEKMCENMSASYLQGYKYSRPVPISALEGYFEKESA